MCPVRHLFSGTQCEACLKEYHTFGKLKNHLLHSRQCREVLQGRRLRTSPQPGAGSRADALLQAHHDHLLPPLQAEGPQPAPSALGAAVTYNLEYVEALFVAFLDAPDLPSCELCVRNSFQDFPISWQVFVSSIDYFLILFTSEDAAVLAVPEQDLRDLLLRLQDPAQWPFLSDSAKLPGTSWRLSMARLEQACVTAAQHPVPVAYSTSMFQQGALHTAPFRWTS